MSELPTVRYERMCILPKHPFDCRLVGDRYLSGEGNEEVEVFVDENTGAAMVIAPILHLDTYLSDVRRILPHLLAVLDHPSVKAIPEEE